MDRPGADAPRPGAGGTGARGALARVARDLRHAATPCDAAPPTPTPPAAPTAAPTAQPTAPPRSGPGPAAVAFTPQVLPAADARPCTVSMRVTGLRSLGRRGYLSVALRTDEACRATISARGFRTVTARLVPGKRLVVKLRRTTSRSRRVAVRVTARDATGNRRTLTRRVRVRR